MDQIYKFLLLIIFLIIVIIVKTNQGKENFDTATTNDIFVHMLYVHELLGSQGIKHCITDGTLLNAIREHNISAYDNTILFGAYREHFAFGVYKEDIEKIMEMNNISELAGYKLYKPVTFGFDYVNLNKSTDMWQTSIIVSYNGLDVGVIYLYQKFNDGYLRKYDIIQKTYATDTEIPATNINKLIQVRIKSVLFPAPNNPETLLKYWYGKNWKNRDKVSTNIRENKSNTNFIEQSKENAGNLTMKYLIDSYGTNTRGDLTSDKLYVFPCDKKAMTE